MKDLLCLTALLLMFHISDDTDIEEMEKEIEQTGKDSGLV